jgi:hypothetical protein
MSDADLVAWHEESPPPRLAQVSLGARRGRGGEPVFTQQRRFVGGPAPMPAPRRSLWRALLALARLA